MINSDQAGCLGSGCFVVWTFAGVATLLIFWRWVFTSRLFRRGDKDEL